MQTTRNTVKAQQRKHLWIRAKEVKLFWFPEEWKEILNTISWKDAKSRTSTVTNKVIRQKKHAQYQDSDCAAPGLQKEHADVIT